MFFETRGVTFDEAKRRQFSFVLINSPALHMFGKHGSDSKTFSEYFNRPGGESDEGVVFDNLGRDARMIAPRPPLRKDTWSSSSSSSSSLPIDYLSPYCHLAKFVREAPTKQVDEVFAMVAREYLHRLKRLSPTNKKQQPVWLSTSGLGVAWLHFRLDSSPKYYQYKPFAKKIMMISKQRGTTTSPSSRRRCKKKDPPNGAMVVASHQEHNHNQSFGITTNRRRRCRRQSSSSDHQPDKHSRKPTALR